MLCFNCQTVGHYARDCPQPRKAGASRSRSVQCHFCDGIWHIIAECEDFREFNRNKSGKIAVVAAGGSSKKGASGPSEPEDASTVSLGDDRPVLCMPHGRVECTLERSDSDAVYMPEITAELQVVGDLSVVQADMIVGVNIIASLGGVDLRFSDGALVGVYFGIVVLQSSAVLIVLGF